VRAKKETRRGDGGFESEIEKKDDGTRSDLYVHEL
jgi:hypothetical protein